MKRILSKLLVGITVCFYLLAVMLVVAITASAGYLTTKGLIMRLVLCFVVSAILFSGIYQGWLINFWYWFVDFNNNGGITGDN